MKFVFRCLGVLALAGLGVLAWRHYFPDDPALIRSMLNGLAKSVSVPAHASPIAGAFAADRARDAFMTNIEVVVDVPGGRRSTFNDREEIVQLCQAAWSQGKSLTVEFCDINVPVCGPENAKAELTARANRPGEPYFFLQTFKLDLCKQDGKWRIAKVAPYDVFR
jgi:hypothetical protein